MCMDPGVRHGPRWKSGRSRRPLVILLLAFALVHVHQPQPAHAAPHPAIDSDSLAVLVTRVLDEHPSLLAVERRIDAAAARVPQLGALPDPTLMVGVMNLPLPDLDPSMEGMTMLGIEYGQRLPPRGLRGVRQAEARAEVAVAEAERDLLRWELRTRMSEAYFELLLVDEALEVHHRTRASLDAFAATARTAYAQGRAPQQDILRAQTEIAAIEEHMAELRQRRAGALAELNALLERPSRDDVAPTMPARLRALLEGEPGPGMLSDHLGGGELGAGFPPLLELERRALATRPEVARARSRAEAAAHAVEAARIERRPGIALTGGYAMRSGRADLFSAGVMVELPLFRGRKQDQAVIEAEHRKDAETLGERALALEIRKEVATAHADLVRAREQVILLEEGVIPQARASVESAAAAYRAGDGDFLRVMESQTLLFRNEIQLAHLVADAGRALARLEHATGSEISMETVP